MRNRSDILDDRDVKASSLQSAQGGFPPRTGALDIDLDILDPMFHGLLAGNFSGNLSGKGSAFAGTFKSLATGTGPRKGIAACIRYGDDGVIEG